MKATGEYDPVLGTIAKLFPVLAVLLVVFAGPVSEAGAGNAPAGAACHRNRDCASNQCSGLGRNRRCTALDGTLQPGARCKRNEECASGQCSGFGDNRRCTERGGQLPHGARCRRDEECQSGECAGLGSNRNCRAVAGELQPGAGCERNKECASGECSGVGRNRKCTALAGQLAPGARCRRNEECESGQCSGVGNDRRCTSLAGQLPPGSRCRRNAECQSGECAGVGDLRRCIARRGRLPAGAKCRVNGDCQSGQCSGAGQNRKCTAVAGQLPAHAPCRRNEECQSGQCSGFGADRRCTAMAGRLAPGASCKRNAECQSGQCSGFGADRKCTAMTGRLEPGAPCKRNEECQSGECYGTGRTRRCTAPTGSLLPGDPCRINKECKIGRCDSIYSLDTDYCEFAGRPCRKGQGKPQFPLRTSADRRGVSLRWLGAASFEISVDEMRIIVDPFMARPWRHFTRGKGMTGAAIGNALSRKQFVEGDPTLPQYMRYYEGITRADWIFVTHGHVDHAAEVGPLLLHLARSAGDRNQQFRIGLIGDKNLEWLMSGYEAKFGLTRLFGAHITQHVVPYELDGSAWHDASTVDPRSQVKTYPLGNGVTTTWYPGHHSQGSASTAAWSERTGPPPMLPISIGSYHSHGIFNFLIRAGGKRIFFMGSTHVHFAKDFDSSRPRSERNHADPLPKGPIDVLLLALPAWDMGNADRSLRILEVLRPKVVIPHHFDDYFWDWRDGCYVMEFANLPRFLREAPKRIREYGLDTKIRQLDFGESYRVR